MNMMKLFRGLLFSLLLLCIPSGILVFFVYKTQNNALMEQIPEVLRVFLKKQEEQQNTDASGITTDHPLFKASKPKIPPEDPDNVLLSFTLTLNPKEAGTVWLTEDPKEKQTSISVHYQTGETSVPAYEYKLNKGWEIENITDNIDIYERTHNITLNARQITPEIYLQSKHKSLFFVEYPSLNDRSTHNASFATAFIAQYNDHYFLITNIHVISNLLEGNILNQKDYYGRKLQLPRFRNMNNKLLFSEESYWNDLEAYLAKDRDIFILKLNEDQLSSFYETYPPSEEEIFTVTDNLIAEKIDQDTVYAFGNKDGEGVIDLSKGRLSSVGPQYLQADIHVVDGDSGSPLFHPSSDRVVGVTSYGFNDKYYFARLDTISEWEPFDINRFIANVQSLQKIKGSTQALSQIAEGNFRDDSVMNSIFWHYLVSSARRLQEIEKGNASKEDKEILTLKAEKDLVRSIENARLDDIKKFTTGGRFQLYGYFVEKASHEAALRREFEKNISELELDEDAIEMIIRF